MKQVQRGFTLIELVMVIVILGVLAAVAIPKFVDLKSDAQQAAMTGVAGAAASASAINYGACAIGNTASAPSRCKVVNTCVDDGAVDTAGSISQALSGAKLPTGYTATGAASTTNGQTLACVLHLAGYTETAPFEVIAAGN